MKLGNIISTVENLAGAQAEEELQAQETATAVAEENGELAQAEIKIEGEGDVQTIVKALGSAGTEDPLNQRQSIGYKINAFAVKRLYEEAIVRYESVPSTSV